MTNWLAGLRHAGAATAQPDRGSCPRLQARLAVEEAGPLRQVLHDYFAWATTTTMSHYHDSADKVPEGMSIPRWSWDGLQR